jgi:hypothetical protein
MRLHLMLFGLLIMLAGIASAYTASDYLKVDRVETDWGHGCIYYTLTNPDQTFSKALAMDERLSTASLNEVYGKVKSSTWERLYANQPYEVDVWKSNVVCETGDIPCDPKYPTIIDNKEVVCDEKTNTTKGKICNDKGEYVKEIRYKDIWAAIDTSKLSSISAKEKIEVRYCADYSMAETSSGWGVAIDQIPKVAGFVYDGKSISKDGSIAPSYQWWNATWLYRAPCYVNTTVTSSLSQFPAHCIMNTSGLITAGKMNTSCQDLRVANSSDNALNYEIENGTCNTTTTVVWLNKPSTNATGNDTIYIYYGNPTAASAQNAPSTWSSYVGVYHMSDGNTVFKDSTGNNDMTVNNTASCAVVTGKYGNAINFSDTAGNSCFGYKLTPSSLPTAAANRSSTAWLYPNSTASSWATPFSWGEGASGKAWGPVTKYNPGGYYGLAGYANDYSTGVATVNSVWQLDSWDYNGTAVLIYKNTTKLNSGAKTYNTGNTAIAIGTFAWSLAPSNDHNYAGVIDELRIRASVSSADWKTAEYAQTDSMGAEESGAAPSSVIATINNPTNTTYYSAANLTVNVTCTGSGAGYYLNVTNGGSLLNNQAVANNTPYTFSHSFANGTTTLNASCANSSTNSTVVVFTMSLTATPTLLSPADASVTGSPVNLSWKCSGSYGAYQSTIAISNWTGSGDPYHSLNDTNVTDLFGFASNGLHRWNITCSNGTTSGTSASWTFTSDTIAPTIAITAPTNTTVFGTSTTLTITATDTHLNRTWYSLDGAANVTYTGSGAISFSDGGHTINAWADDTVGNVNSTSLVFTSYTLPVSTLVSPADNAYTDSYAFTWACSGSTSSFSGRLFIDGALSGSTTCSGMTDCAVTSSLLSCEPHTWLGECRDTNGYYANSSMRTVNTLATISGLSPANGTSATNDSPVTFSAISSCQAASAALTLDGAMHSMSCAVNSCSYTNTSRANANMTWQACFNLLNGSQACSALRTLLVSPGSGYTTNVTIKNYTWTDYEDYTNTFYADWSSYILGIFTLAVSFMLGKTYSQIFLTGGIGLVGVFLIASNPVLLAGGILLIVLSFIIKYVTGQ